MSGATADTVTVPKPAPGLKMPFKRFSSTAVTAEMPSAVLTNPSGRGAPGTPASLGLSHHALASARRQEAVQPSLRCAQYGSGFHRNRSLRLAPTIAGLFVGRFLCH